MSTPTVGLVGFGRWGRLIFRDLRALGAEVHVAVPSESSRAAALDAGAASVAATAADLPDADGYVIAPLTVRHAEAVRALLPRGRPMFVEKPLTADPASAAELVDAAGERIFVMDKWRYHPGVVELARLARSGAFGPIRSITSHRLGWGNPHRDVDAVWILLPHDLSIAIEILGSLPQPRFAAAPDTSGSGLVAVLRDDDGPLVTCEVSADHPVNCRTVVVVGEHGSGQLADSWDDRILLAGTVDGVGITPESRERAVGAELPLEAELRAFLEHLAGGPAPRSSAIEALSVVRAIATLRTMAGLPGATA
ncbi:Gfo/Idh/MocA family oxidoreductase [Nocardioides carbamazepini]|uniref:Gfo/Idh/MocA family protein n=1 Tax=Nocardioides carbamazepini TaxID=2854259 RepID=UPI00214A5B91|nr:Gfo/Idh/MocA family oxidoreductase [Nocardioides carbamazepini]MCR1783611.1 Gfo/Idh/MocA family oxidoreductase [Nocardioides carbamazepini]